MKSLVEACLIGSIVICVATAQETQKPPLQAGVSVQMPVANHALEMRAADDPNATVLAITAGGQLFVGIAPTEPGTLSSLRSETVYLKADARAPFQKVLTVLDALRGKSVILLSTAPANAAPAKIVPPYGIKLIVSK